MAWAIPNEMLNELDGHVFVEMGRWPPVPRRSQPCSDRKSATQAVPSACSRWPPVGRGRAAVEDADIIQPQESALEEILAETGLCG